MMKASVIVLLLSISQWVFAFGDVEHRLICNAAYELTKPETQQFIDKIIERGDRVKVNNFADGCVWPDQVRKFTHRETDQYHYMNVPKGKDLDHARDCAAFDCVTQAIQRYALALNSPAENRTNRKEALFFLGHFVADIHQPLHVGNAEDKGGNTIKVISDEVKQDKTNLHRLWDRHVPQYAQLNSVDTLLADISNRETLTWQKLAPIEWAIESHQLANQYVYVMPDGVAVKSGDVITEQYYLRAKPIIKQRFEQAAVRLALMLDYAASGQLTVEKLN